jgi:hypothetical protein
MCCVMAGWPEGSGLDWRVSSRCHAAWTLGSDHLRIYPRWRFRESLANCGWEWTHGVFQVRTVLSICFNLIYHNRLVIFVWRIYYLLYTMTDCNTNHFNKFWFFSFSFDVFERHTFWWITAHTTIGWMLIHGANQSSVQRYSSCKSVGQAKM